MTKLRHRRYGSGKLLRRCAAKIFMNCRVYCDSARRLFSRFAHRNQLPTQAMQSVCIVRLSALGDVLMCVPLVRALQAHNAHLNITWVISNPAYQLVEGMQGIEFIVIDKPNTLLDYWRFKKRLANRRFDVLFGLQASFRANLLYPCIRAKRKLGFDPLRAKDGHGWFVHERIKPGRDHTLESFLKFAHLINIPTPKVVWDLPIPLEAVGWATAHMPTDGPILVINPAASKSERSWLVERYVGVIRYAQDKYGMHVVLTGGPGTHDAELGAAIAREVTVINLIGQTKPKQLLAVLAKATVVICPDTGPSHMAAAVNTPVIALQAVTNALISGPYPFLNFAVNRYPDAVSQVFGQTVETCVWGTHVHGPEAMQLITVEDVTNKLDLVYASYAVRVD